MTDVLGCFMVVDMSHNFSDCTLYVPLVRYHLRLQGAAPGKSRAPRVEFLFAETVLLPGNRACVRGVQSSHSDRCPAALGQPSTKSRNSPLRRCTKHPQVCSQGFGVYTPSSWESS